MTTRIFICSHCRERVAVRVKVADIDKGGRLDPRRPIVCPLCKKGSFFSVPTVSATGWVPITVNEFMFFLEGLAMPGEVVTQKESVVAMLLAHKIVDVDADNANDRCVLNSVKLDNGVRLFLAASGMGAVVWRALREENENASDGNGTSHDHEPVRDEAQEEHAPGSGQSGSCDCQLHRREGGEGDAPRSGR